MHRIRRELPRFGTSGRLWRVRPDARRVGVLHDFEPGDQEPFNLPDGGRLWVDLTSLAGGNHQLGPATRGTVWVRSWVVDARRRADHVVLRSVRQVWALKPNPTNDHQLRGLLSTVKEVDGVFLPTDITMDRVWWQDYPGRYSTRDRIESWTKGAAWERLRPRVIERLRAQRETNQANPVPEPTLSKEELAPFPHNFHPWLRRMDDTFIRLDEDLATAFPNIIADYRAWDASERAREREWTLDERLPRWPSWQKVPPYLRPWFAWDETFKRPGPMHLEHSNPYEKAMCHRALNWWNTWMIAGIRDALEK